jgi:hypothetical protein
VHGRDIGGAGGLQRGAGGGHDVGRLRRIDQMVAYAWVDVPALHIDLQIRAAVESNSIRYFLR